MPFTDTEVRVVSGPSVRRLAGPLLLVAMAGLLVTSVWLQWVRERHSQLAEAIASPVYVPDPSAARRLALGFDDLAADLYWIRAIQHYGGVKRSDDSDKRYEHLRPLLEMTTSLDPHFTLAYRFGAIFLAEAYPDGPGRPSEAIALLEKGVEADPTKWEYLMDIGFVHYWWLHDYSAASAWFQKASRVPEAPWWLASLAATTEARGGDRGASRLLWRQIRETADHDWLRQDAERRLSQLLALDQIDELTAIVERFNVDQGSFPPSWETLIAAGYLGVYPVDPAGVGYVLEPRSVRVSVSEASPLFPLPGEPPRQPRPQS